MTRAVTAPGPISLLNRWLPIDERVAVSDAELSVLIACSLLTTVGLAGDISRHLLNPDALGNDFLSGWHLVLYGGVTTVGIWLGVGVIRHQMGFLRAAAGTTVGFALLAVGGVCDAAWHHFFGTEAAVEALVSPPHLVVFTGLVLMLTSPIVIVWKRPSRRLGVVASIAVTVSLVATVLVISLFTGFLTPLAGGLSLQAGYTEPLIGESTIDYDQVRGLGIAVWTVAVVVAAFTLVSVRFRLVPGCTLAAFALIGLPAIAVSGTGLFPVVIGFTAAGVVAEILVAWWGRPTLGRVGAAGAGALIGATLWAATFIALKADGRLGWNVSLWAGTVTMSALVGAATASITALPAPTGSEVAIGPAGPTRPDSR